MKKKDPGKNRECQYKNTPEYRIWLAGLLLGILAAVGALFVLYLPIHVEDLGLECFVHRAGGIYCPGCGGTRAVFALIHGKVLASFILHPVVLYAAACYLVFMLRGAAALLSGGRVPFMKWRLGYVYVGIAVILIQFLVKNISLLVFHLQWMP